MGRIELPTSPLPRECSATELHGPSGYIPAATATATTCKQQSRRGAGEGNRTLVLSLEGFSSTIELHPHKLQPQLLRSRPNFMVEGEGFEPSKAEPSDLQSDPFDRSGIPPMQQIIMRNPKISVKRFRETGGEF